MRPTRLELRNFMSYEDAAINLKDINIAAVVGPNGAGKSSILQAITYALWGQVRTTSHNDVVRRGTGTCAVSLEFSMGDTIYTVIRRRHLAGKGSTDLELATITPSNKYIPLTKATIRETQAEINRILGMSYEAFSSSALLQQGEASKFSNARPGERKELLAEMLNLSWLQVLERMARIRLKEIDGSLLSTTALLEDRKRELESADSSTDIAGAIDEAIETKEDIETRLDLKRRGLAFDRECLDKVKSFIAELDGKEELRTSYEERRDDILAEIDLLETKKGILGKLCEDADHITAEKDRVDELRQELALMSDMAIEVAGLQAKAAGLEEDERSLDELWVKRGDLTLQIEKLEQDLGELEADLSLALVALGEMKDRCTVATTDVLSATTKREGMVDRKNLLSGPDPICPTCHSELENKDSVLAGIEQKIAEISDAIAALEVIEKGVYAGTRDVEQDCKDIEGGAEAAKQSLTTHTSDLRVLVAEIDGVELRFKRKKEAQFELDELDFNQEWYDELKLAVADAKKVDDKYAALIAAQKEVAEIAISLVEKQDRLDKGTKLLANLHEEIEELHTNLSKEPDKATLESQITSTEITVIALQSTLSETEREIVRLEGIKERLDTLARDIKGYESKLGLLEKDRVVCDWLVKASSKTGAQALLIEAAIPQLEKDANALLKVMTNNMEMAINSQRQTLKGDSVETLDIVVYSDGQVAPIETLSGGERYRADLALRLAIGRMVSRRSSTVIEMLAVDEGFGSQDDDGQDTVVEVILSLQSVFGLILVISHVKAVAESIGVVGNMITVSKVGNISTLEVT